MYKLKTTPADFIVREISNVQIKYSGKYIYFTLTKENKNTFDVLQQISQILHVPLNNIGYAGTKDKHAITEQICSVHGASRKSLEKIELQGIEIKFVGYGNDPISLGDLEANTFEIVVRNIGPGIHVQQKDYFINYFDEQRFSRNNVDVGRAIVKKDFAKAVKLVDNERCREHIRDCPTDNVGALKKLPKKLLLLYVHAYQSYMWNEAVVRYLKQQEKKVKKLKYSVGEFVFVDNLKNFESVEIPLVGFFTELDQIDDNITLIIEEIMQEEEIIQQDFIIKQIPNLSVEGTMRKIVEKIDNLVISNVEEDELHEGKKKVTLTFSLTKGNYATMVVKQILLN